LSPKDLLELLLTAAGGDHLLGRPRAPVGDQDGTPKPFREDLLEALVIDIKLEPAVARLDAPLPADDLREERGSEPAVDAPADDGLGEPAAGFPQVAREPAQALEDRGERRGQAVQLLTGKGGGVLQHAQGFLAMHDGQLSGRAHAGVVRRARGQILEGADA